MITRFRNLGTPALLIAAAFFVGCTPTSATDAEAKGNVRWLDQNGGQDAIAALGRLADTHPEAAEALQRRADTDVAVYIAAWHASARKASWGDTLMRAALHDPARAGAAAQAIPRRDPHIVHLAKDLDDAVALNTADGPLIAGVLASAGKGAEEAIAHRLGDPASRAAMCQGISSPGASAEARAQLLSGPTTFRDHPSCTVSLLTLAQTDDTVLHWLGSKAEPGLLTATAKGTLPCERLAIAWRDALTYREAAQRPTLTFPVAKSVERCGSDMDAPFSEAIQGERPGQAAVVFGVDGSGAYRDRLPKTCAALRQLVARKGEHDLTVRAGDLLRGACSR